MTRHAAERLAERHGLAFTGRLVGALLALVEAAPRRGGRHERAAFVRFEADGRERWLVSLTIGGRHHLLMPVVDPRQQQVVTFLTTGAR